MPEPRDADFPLPEARPVELTAHGHVRTDPWYWLGDAGSPSVVRFLHSENDRGRLFLRDYEGLRGRWEADWQRDARHVPIPTPAYRLGPFEYQWAGDVLRRRRHTPMGEWQRVVDMDVYGANGPGYRRGALSISPDHRFVAFAFERRGSERFMVRIVDIERRRDTGDLIDDAGSTVAWSGGAVVYTRLDEKGIPSEVWRHELGTKGSDTALWTRSDPTRLVAVADVTPSRTYVQIFEHDFAGRGCSLLDESGAVLPIRPHGPDDWFDVHHREGPRGGMFVLSEQHSAAGGRVLAADGDDIATTGGLGEAPWRQLHASAAGQQIDGVSLSDHRILIGEWGEANQVLVLDASDGRLLRTLAIDGADAPNDVSLRFSADGVSDVISLTTTGPLTPTTGDQLDPATGTRVRVFAMPPPKGVDLDAYELQGVVVDSTDGAAVPLSVLQRRDLADRGPRPFLMHGYGAYGHRLTRPISRPLLSLLDRGWRIGFAHVRGGGERGPAWHADGRGLRKQHSIDDFLACAEHVVSAGLTVPSKLGARGGSAGGLLVAAAMNQRPDLFRAIVAEVPWVDTLTDLMEPARRGTAANWLELGNPVADADAYRCILSYSPYDNVRRSRYPGVLLTGGLNDPRVSFDQPAKLSVKLRSMKLDDNPVLLRTAFESGHAARTESGRHDESFVLAFLVSQLEGDGP